MTRLAQRTAQPALLGAPFWILGGMAVGSALFYRGGAVLGGFPALVGLAIFGLLALARPDLGLLFVPLTAPLYLIPATIEGIRATPLLLPLHEVALLLTAGATFAGWLWSWVGRHHGKRRVSGGRDTPIVSSHEDTNARRQQNDIIEGFESARLGGKSLAPFRQSVLTGNVGLVLRRYAPHALFLAAGVLGVLLAVERARALREFRWVIAEPLLFYGLVSYYAGRRAAGDGGSRDESFLMRLVAAFVVGGALVGLVGLLQYVGVDLAPLLGRKQCFASDGGPCANIVEDGGVRRVLSVYGHPNNLGLYLGRVWPVAMAPALAALLGRLVDRRPKTEDQRPMTALVFGLSSLLCLGGIVVSFSRGAWLGAVAAAVVLVLGLTKDQRPRTKGPGGVWSFALGPWSRLLIGLGVTAAIAVALALSIRGDVTAGSTPVRLLLWREAAGYIARHPLGIGLDQFGLYHDPASGLSLIDPSLLGSSEEYAAHPHNLLLDTWLRIGPLGLLAFGWLLTRFLRAAWRREPGWSRGFADSIVLGAAAAMVAALVHGMVDNFYFVSDLAMAFWLLIALVEWVGTIETIRIPPRHQDTKSLSE